MTDSTPPTPDGEPEPRRTDEAAPAAQQAVGGEILSLHGSWARLLFFVLVVRPLVLLLLGLNVRRRKQLPTEGPAILVANHNSHLDTLILMSLFPLRLLPLLRPVAAADYFLRSKGLAWFALRIIGILPIERGAGRDRDPLRLPEQALRRGDILILFPEGSRGEAESLSRFKTGVAHLVRRCPEVPVVPLFLHGAGKALPKGEAILVPFFCDVFVGEPLHWSGDKAGFMQQLQSSIEGLAAEGNFPAFE